jgi:RNA polymerase sigma-70 factor, ECF subfamily
LFRVDPLEHPESLIRRVYAYAAYRMGDGPDAEDVTSDTFERALRYRKSYDPSRGAPVTWLLGIARRCIDDFSGRRLELVDEAPEPPPAPARLEEDVGRRLQLAAAIGTLGERERELIALRYGADLTAREIGDLLGLQTNAVEVALHRALGRLRAILGEAGHGSSAGAAKSEW